MWVNAVAAKGMFGDLNPLGDGPCRSLADNGARLPKVLPAAKLQGFLTGLIVAMPPERERRLLLSWAKARNDSKGRNKATRSEGDDLGDSAARALTCHGGRGRGGRG